VSVSLPNSLTLLIAFLCTWAFTPLAAQQDTIPTSAAEVDTLQTDTGDTLLVRISKDALESAVRYKSLDTQWIDLRNKAVHLIGEAEVQYGDIELNAGYIIYSFESSIVTARGIPDSAGEMSQYPHFRQGSQEFRAHEMRYNFRTRKAISIHNTTLEGDLHVLTDKAKFVGASQPSQPDYIYGRRAIITTCDHKVPHFGIRCSKQKIVTEKSVIVGPSNIEIAGVPTPIWLPFGFFPIPSKRKAGIIFSLNYDFRQDIGYGLREIGYFTPLGEHANLSILGDIYTRGSYRVAVRSEYRKRYRYNGNGEITFANLQRENPETGALEREPLFNILFRHNQDPKANPYHNLSGSIQFQSSAFARLNFYDANNVLNNSISSSLNYRRTWDGKPFQLTTSLTQAQNLRSGTIDMTLPQASFVVQRIQPFKRKGGGIERWYERIGVSYDANLISRLSAPDSTFFSAATLQSARPGLQQRATVNSNFNLFKYFNFTPNITYTEVWNYNTLRRENDRVPLVRRDTVFNPDGSIVRVDTDTLSFGTVSTRLVNDFKTFRTLTYGMGMNTAIFGTMRFSKGWLRGLRHTIKPNMNLSFMPGNSGQPWFDFVPGGRTPTYEDLSRYSFFEGGPFGAPNFNEGSMSLNYSFNNIFEAKYFSRKAGESKKVNLFDNIFVAGSYNFFADSLKWSPVTVSGGTNLIRGVSRLDVRFQFDPYALDETGRPVNRFYWDTEGKLLRFVNANFRLANNITVGRIRQLITGEQAAKRTDMIGLLESFALQHNITMDLRPVNGKDTLVITTNAINTAGSVQISEKWSIGITNIGYDFNAKQITYPSFNFTRDLHCWEMLFGWFPQIGAYTFMIKVKPGTLDFIKVPYRRNSVGNFVGFGI
jgi:hypothetical protein